MGIQSLSREQLEYAAFIDNLGFESFSGNELARLAQRKRGRVTNAVPPVALWPKIVRTLAWAQAIRSELGPLAVNSAYRSPKYNQAVGGEPNSFHMRNMALDISPVDVEVSVRRLWEAAKGWRGKRVKLPGNEGYWVISGGLGLYEDFVHIDCRGVDANW